MCDVDTVVGSKSSDRDRPAATLVVILAPKQSTSSSKKRATVGSEEGMILAAAVRRIVEARSTFFSQCTSVSLSLLCAFWRTTTSRRSVVRSCMGTSCWGFRTRAVMNLRRMGKASGTRASWHAGVLSSVVNICRIQACKSDFMTAGKTCAASTRAVKEEVTRPMMSGDNVTTPALVSFG